MHLQRWNPAALVTCAGALLGCGGGPDCTLDTECPLVTVCVEGRCQAVPEPPDAGVPDFGLPDDLGLRDEGLAPDLGVDAGVPELRRGTVVAKSQSVLEAGGVGRATSELTARFEEAFGEERCTTRVVGDCTLESCTFVPDPDRADMGASAAPGAGIIIAGAGLLGPMGTPVALGIEPGEDGTYRRIASNGPLWDGTQEVRIQADGDRVPGFEVSVPPPPQLELQTPAGFAGLSIDPTRDLVLGWTPAAGSFLRVVFALPSADAGAPERNVTCLYRTERGEGVIGAEVFGDAPLGVTIEVSVEATNWNVQELPGGWEVVVAARSDVRASLGERAARGTARLELATTP